MLPSPDAFLIVEKANPYTIGDALSLSRAKAVLGRTAQEFKPDFSFLSPYVSRQHATIEYIDGSYTLTDLGSRHGTWINNVQLVPGVQYQLCDHDRIGLANKDVVLVFAHTASKGGITWDLPTPQSEQSPKPVLGLNQDRREVVMEGRVLHPPLSGKLYTLLEVLYASTGSMVSDDEIKRRVWPERCLDADGGLPQVDDTELYTLVGRLRRSLKPHADLIRRIRDEGYVLDLPS